MSSINLYVFARKKSRVPQLTFCLFAGMLLGCFSAILIGGFISESLGWPFVFYIFGGIGCVCCLLWFIVIYDDPTSYPWISTSEKEYIISSLKQQVRSSQQPLPIKAVLRSLPIWSICLGCFSHQWLVSTMVVYIPTYISSVYHINIRDVSMFPSLPFSCLHGWPITLPSLIIPLREMYFLLPKII